MQPQDVSVYYDTISSQYDRRRFRGQYHRDVAKKEEAFVATHAEGKLLLEVGPGTGRFTQHLVRGDRTVSVCDISEQMLEQVRDKLGDVPNVSYHKLPIEKLSTLHTFGAYDTAIAMRIIPHVPDWKGAITALKGAVKPGGLIIFDLWNNESFIGLSRKLFRRRSDVLTHRLRRAEIMAAVNDLDADVVATLRWGYPRIGRIHLDTLGSRLFPAFAYSTVFCCRTR